MLQKKAKRTGLISSLILTVIFLSAAAVIIIKHQTVIDIVNYLEYRPSALMQSFAQRTTMSSEGKFLFYSAKPSLESKDQFNSDCPSASPDVAILGCYNGQDIYIYNVTDTQLDGIRDVTAAYEMLHAAYKRLSPSDLSTVNSLIETEFSKDNDSSMHQIVSYFAKSEPGQRDNELFSLIATQDPTISPQLETYYNRYFTNRQALVALYNKYSSVFTSLANQASQLSSELTSLNTTIKTQTAQYNADVASLNTDIDTFNKNAQDNNFSSQSEFDSQKAALAARETALQAEQAKINSEIDTYNTELSEYNAITTSSKQLYNSINSNSLSTAPSS
jgi:cell division septum initiation protein DivIVA